MTGPADDANVPRVDRAATLGEASVCRADEQVADPASHQAVPVRGNRADDHTMPDALLQRDRARVCDERRRAEAAPVVGEQVPVTQIAHPRGARGDDLGEPASFGHAGQRRGEPGDATHKGRPLMWRANRHRRANKVRPAPFGRGLGQRAVQHQATHRMTDEDQTAQWHRPRLHQPLEQVIEGAAVSRHPQAGVVAHPDRRPHPLGLQPSRVALPRLPPVAFRANVPPVVGFDEPVQEDDDQVGRAGVCRPHLVRGEVHVPPIGPYRHWEVER